VRVVVADDVMLTREGIVRLLRDAGIDVVAQAEDAEALLREVRKEQPDVAVVDIKMPPTHTNEGLVAAQAIRADHPETGVLVLSQYVEERYAAELLAGASCGAFASGLASLRSHRIRRPNLVLATSRINCQ